MWLPAWKIVVFFVFFFKCAAFESIRDNTAIIWNDPNSVINIYWLNSTEKTGSVDHDITELGPNSAQNIHETYLVDLFELQGEGLCYGGVQQYQLLGEGIGAVNPEEI